MISQLSHHVTHVQNLSTTPLSACPGDLLSYAGIVLCIVLTPASLSFSPTLRLNATIELSPSVHCRRTQSQNPLGPCLNWKFILNSFAAHTVCMDHFASLVPNHEKGCSAHCYCFGFREGFLGGDLALIPPDSPSSSALSSSPVSSRSVASRLFSIPLVEMSGFTG